jgi:RNase adaptor protein for sRNA GlmZ degradation
MKLTKDYILEGKLIKANAELTLHETHLQEAFGSGKAASVAEKLGNILGRKIGYNINMSDIPLAYGNAYGEFAGYLGAVSNGMFIKINFKLSGSDSIESFDMYLDGLSDTPSYTVETTGLNIIQIVNLMVENLIDDGEVDERVLEESFGIEYKNKIEERGSLSDTDSVIDVIGRFVQEDKARLKDLQSKPVPEIFTGIWGDWVSDKPNYQIKFYLFSKSLKQYLLSNGMTNKNFRQRKKGSKERQIEDPLLAEQLDEIVETLSWKEKFAFIDSVVQDAAKGNIKSVIVKGSPGSGKTFQIKQSLDKAGYEYKTYSGGVKSLDDLIRILYNNADKDVTLVFDDFDSVLSKSDSANIFKAILQDSPERVITYVDVARDAKKNMKDIPPRFVFEPSIIFITNKTKMDSAIESRSVVLDITLTNDEMIEKIEGTLKEYRPEIDMNIKKTALEFCQEISKGVSTIDYRMMDNVLRAIQLSPGNWKKVALWMMKSV